MPQIDLFEDDAIVRGKIRRYMERGYDKVYFPARRVSHEMSDSEFLDILDKNGIIVKDFINGDIQLDILHTILLYAFVKGKYKTIVDPTCGVKNYGFSKILDIMRYWRIEYKACDILTNNWSGRVCNVFDVDSLPEGDVFFYDPPFGLASKSPRHRLTDYVIHENKTIEDVMRFYSREVFEHFETKGAKLIIVKGFNAYYPATSDNLYLLEHMVEMPQTYKIISAIEYSYYRAGTPLLGARMARSLHTKNYMRSLIMHSKYLIYKKI